MSRTSGPIGEAFAPATFVDYATGSVVSKTILDKSVGQLTLFSFDRGQGLTEHTSPYDAVVEVLDGKAEITVGGALHHVEAGEMIIMPAHVPHSLHAGERFKMLLIMIREKVDKNTD